MNIITEFEFLDLPDSLSIVREQSLTLIEILERLNCDIATNQGEPPAGFERVDEKWLDLARMWPVTGRKLPPAKFMLVERPAGLIHPWTEVRYLDSDKRQVTIFPNDASADPRVMLYAPGEEIDGVVTLQVISVEIWNRSEGYAGIGRGAFRYSATHCLIDSSGNCVSSQNGHPCEYGSWDESDLGWSEICYCPHC
ncbi:hypothetical protein [Streptomyces sp. NPDC048637]|uniref:hypothetical protein n=1 Tax=Streptomyces sp. NPDC048637 TaxID=3155636 RepID=UPI0034191F60